MACHNVEVVNLSRVGLSQEESRKAAVWMANAFQAAPATPALTIFFGAAPYEENGEMHERFWASHLNRVAMTGILVGAREQGEWIGFRAFFEPGKSRQPYTSDFRLQDNEGWDRFLELTNEASYMARIKEWGEKTGQTNVENGLTPAEYYTTSILVVNPRFQRRGVGSLLDNYTLNTTREAEKRLHIRIHQYILPFYLSQGYRLVASPVYTLCGSNPFKVHFLIYDGEK